MWKKYRYIVVLVLSAWVIASCAKVMPLTGGDQDSKAPEYRSSNPDTFSLNFKGKSITIKFDEYISLVDPTREIIVSPPIDPVPEFMANGKSIKIKFKDTLRPNVTYVINFGESIVDITESNKSKGFSFVFSTGTFIDSGMVRGTITDAFTGKPAEGYKVMLYDTNVTDSFPYKEKPFYLAFTNEVGVFKLNNLRWGKYKIFALQEDNNNYIFDRSGEKIAFIDDLVYTGDSVDIKMQSFAELGGPIKFNKAKSISSVRTDFYFSGDASKVKISPLKGVADTSFWRYEFNQSKDTVTLWHNPIQVDTASFLIVEETTRDTSEMKINKGPMILTPAGRRNKNVPTANISLNASGNMKFDLYSAPVLSLNEPTRIIDTSLIKLLADSVPQAFTLNPDSISPRKLIVNFNRQSNKKYQLVCDSAAFVSISEKVSSASSFTFGFREKVEYASIKVNYEDSILKFPKIWHLLKDDKMIRETFAAANRNDVIFNSLEPGSYKVRLILDENGNKQWDTGKFIDKKQPERVLYLAETIELKAGWDSEISWKVKKSSRGK